MTPTNFLWAGGAAAKALGIPAFWEIIGCPSSGYRFDLNKRIYRTICRWHHLVLLANSRYSASSLAKGNFQPRLLYLGADTGTFCDDKLLAIPRSELGIPAGAPVFCIIARLNPEKGQEVVIDALADLGLCDPPPHLVLVGDEDDPAYRAVIEAKVAQSPAGGRIHIIGLSAEPQRWMALADVVINSRISAESFGLSVIEAMLVGRPMLVHALGGPAETVLDGQTGWHVHTPTVAGFRAALRLALSQRDRWPAMGAAARAHAQANFTSDIQGRNYLAIVEAQIAKLGTSACRGQLT